MAMDKSSRTTTLKRVMCLWEKIVCATDFEFRTCRKHSHMVDAYKGRALSPRIWCHVIGWHNLQKGQDAYSPASCSVYIMQAKKVEGQQRSGEKLTQPLERTLSALQKAYIEA